MVVRVWIWGFCDLEVYLFIYWAFFAFLVRFVCSLGVWGSCIRLLGIFCVFSSVFV